MIQTSSSLTAIPYGAFPISIVSTTSYVAGSMRETLFSAVFATQTEPDPTATAVGPRPTSIVLVEPAAGSIRVTESSDVFATQIAPSP